MPTHSTGAAPAAPGWQRLAENAMAIALGVMALAVFVNVVLRYGFGSGIAASEELSRLMFVWLVFIGAAAAYRAGGHIAVGMLTDALPAPLQTALAKLVHVLMLGVCGFVVLYGARLCRDTMGQSIAELPILPVGITYLPIPLGALATAIFVLEHLLAGPQKHRPVVTLSLIHI